MLSTLTQDLRYAVRTIFGTPVVSIAAIVTIALAVGANTAIFSADNAYYFDRSPTRTRSGWSKSLRATT